MNRREFFTTSLAGAAAPFSRAPKYDLVIKGGRVLDASQRLDRVMDIAVRAGKIATLEINIAESDAIEVFDATGKLVTPGLVDIHAHPRLGELSPEPAGRNCSRRRRSSPANGGRMQIGDQKGFARMKTNRYYYV